MTTHHPLVPLPRGSRPLPVLASTTGGYTLSNTSASNYREITVTVIRATTGGAAGVWTATGTNNSGGTSSSTTIVAYALCTP